MLSLSNLDIYENESEPGVSAETFELSKDPRFEFPPRNRRIIDRDSGSRKLRDFRSLLREGLEISRISSCGAQRV